MKRLPTTCRYLALALALDACGGAETVPTHTTDTGTGVLQVTLSSAQAEVRCLQITTESDSRVVPHEFVLNPAEKASIYISELPLGLVLVDAFGFEEACQAITPSSMPRWVARVDSVARIRPTNAAHIVLHLIDEGRTPIDDDSPALQLGMQRAANIE